MKRIILFLLTISLFVPSFGQDYNQILKKAQELKQAKQYYKAKDLFFKLTMEKQDAQAYLGLGECYIALGMPDSAFAALKKAQMLSPNNDQIYFNLGLVNLTGYGKADQAREYFLKAYKLQPDSLKYALYIGLSYQAKGRLDSAVDYYETVMKKDTANPYPYYFLADYLFEIDSLQQAYDFVNKAISKNPKNYNFYYLRASIEYKARLYELALNDINKALSFYPDSYKLQLFKAQVLYQLQQYNKAIPILEKLVQEQTNKLNAYYYLAWSYYYTAQYDRAIKIARQALDKSKNTAEFYQLLAYTYIAQGEYTKAQKAADKLLKISPGNMTAYNLKITATLLARTPENVIGSDKKFTKINALNTDFIKNAINNPASQYYYQKLLNKFSTKPDRLSLDEYAMLYLGYGLKNKINRTKPAEYASYYQKGQYQQCIEAAKKAISVYPLDQNAYFYLALSYNKLTQPEDFIKNLTIYHGLQKAIAATGDGMSYETAYLITNEQDIFYVLNYTVGNPAKAINFGMASKIYNGQQYRVINIGFRPKQNNQIYFLMIK